MKMKFKLNVKTITLSVIVFIVTIISLYYLILDMDSIAFAEQIDQQFITDDRLSALEERKKKLLLEEEAQREWDRMTLNAAVSLSLLVFCVWASWYFWNPVG